MAEKEPEESDYLSSETDESEESSTDSYSNEEFEEGKENAEIIESEDFREEEYSMDELVYMYRSAYHYSLDNFYNTLQEIKESYNAIIKENNTLKEDKQKLIQIYSSSKELIEELKKRDDCLTKQYDEILDKYEEEQRSHTKTIEELQELKKSELFGSTSANVIASLNIKIEHGKVENIEVVQSMNSMENDSLMKISLLEKTIEEKMRKEKILLEEKERITKERELEVQRINNEKNQMIHEKEELIEKQRIKEKEMQDQIQLMETQLKAKDELIMKKEKLIEESLLVQENKTRHSTAQSEVINESTTPKDEYNKTSRSVGVTPSFKLESKKRLMEISKQRTKKSLSEIVKAVKDFKNKGIGLSFNEPTEMEKYSISEFKLSKTPTPKKYLYANKTPFYMSFTPIEGIEASPKELFLIKSKRNKSTELVSFNKKTRTERVIADNVLPNESINNDNFLIYHSNGRIIWYSYRKRTSTRIKFEQFKCFIPSIHDIYILNKINELYIFADEKITFVKKINHEFGINPYIVGTLLFSLKNKKINSYEIMTEKENNDSALNDISAFTICNNNIWLAMPMFNQIGIVSFNYQRIKTIPMNFTPSIMKVYGNYVFIAGRTHYSIISSIGNIVYNAEIKVSMIDSICLAESQHKRDCRMIILSNKELYDFGTKLQRHNIIKSEVVGTCCICGQNCMDLECSVCHKKYHDKCFTKTMHEIEPCCEMK
ncbi:hypothetical protein EHI8A_014610 [Entamoeba histolytica HM-1:IMSS-B]|uniref:Uncharacterized protein n=6 Tax=Entamoeba histolytica TaxID=5759 RepID=C4M498_ENTH1|nr:hypothetical protein EHI_098010 [Entamoeba histolytica HM-1:IMSS]EMD48791.1 Hypothetical protein EHI5A_029170 [Entamoeba histolytica KU27]EMH77007.1 hypothetical protein EHI8A_014610 [Entamoeba histolytica HM-1:IMSS-B]EMS11002.1 hypothetical protein KM1_030730 [Entamoeba histolytica HM-3:IMSS]ENY62949.1 hypothetical protein EHI7A_013500 [Entamoeba histolytica HM-1:IMSS-A]GAT96183.1 hypothetical protein CL6EHI_098010 [Entamoeba histolytica]|eukprot:XP_651058.1 hypothetical protein EHI_098010 [Entamoeba histolytica HM-1:IMSS]